MKNINELRDALVRDYSRLSDGSLERLDARELNNFARNTIACETKKWENSLRPEPQQSPFLKVS
jgi:hypothetical protein